jgi:hypothetical protein
MTLVRTCGPPSEHRVRDQQDDIAVAVGDASVKTSSAADLFRRKVHHGHDESIQ